MAYDPTIPALENYIGDDIPKIMANFVELAGSRIVDHNLDVPSPPNGYYVRWENGLQICWIWQLALDNFNNTNHITGRWNFPATFANTRYDAKATRLGGVGGASGFKVKDIWVEGALTTRVSVSLSSDGQFSDGDIYYAKLHAIGMWK